MSCFNKKENVVELFESITMHKEDMTKLFELLSKNAAVAKDWTLFYFFHDGLDMRLKAGEEKVSL